MALNKITDKLVNPPFWPHGFLAANILFAMLAIASILVLIHDQKLAARSAKLQEKNFAVYRDEFDRATHVKIRLLAIIARKLQVPENMIQETVKPVPLEID